MPPPSQKTKSGCARRRTERLVGCETAPGARSPFNWSANVFRQNASCSSRPPRPERGTLLASLSIRRGRRVMVQDTAADVVARHALWFEPDADGMAPLLAAIGDASYVLIGEASH